jgi:hypothetical protein
MSIERFILFYGLLSEHLHFHIICNSIEQIIFFSPLMNNKLNKELIIQSRMLKNTEDYQVFEDIFKLQLEGLLTIEDFDTLCYGFDDESEDFDYLCFGMTQALLLIMKNYTNEDFTKKIVNAIEIFNNHALFSYGRILTYWFIKDDRVQNLCTNIKTKNDEVKDLFRKVITIQINYYSDGSSSEDLIEGANKVLQGIE